MLNGLFQKRVVIYKKRDRESYQKIREVLKAEGVSFKSGHYLQETVMGGGCGAKLDPRDFGGKGKIDRDIYWVSVPEGKEGDVREILRKNGIVPVVEENILQDAALRKRPQEQNQF
ncbi:MAG: hypothetical protein IIZ39_09055 [Blautia sp.]|nr:hypothetical protein [Blautia sp.]